MLSMSWMTLLQHGKAFSACRYGNGLAEAVFSITYLPGPRECRSVLGRHAAEHTSSCLRLPCSLIPH